ncbi:SDR family oxidoreductase [Leptothermofonsia sichuanensis E412]|uniref:SDR family NAD(P)-dependent oxidoreductase n=1 Tax=Leptothermofonsia sichuanensis TaxID=2917832 RepID=UPI001CA63DF9|nr:SDR family oxidoreductase [Leptothermofonsia sichuanensis]QZZ18710.1 SDR family oxidoreductase [Leptothermofonsia sichuanensis E412]
MAPTVLITGASQGIGRETALIFARHGYNLALAARNSERLEAFARDLRASNHPARAISTDVKDPEQVKTLVEKAMLYFGSIDVLINNAGIYTSGPVEEFTLEDWHQAIDTNLWGYIHTIHAILPHFLEQAKGTIVNVSCIGGKVPFPYLLPYTTSKFAVTGLTEALRTELAPQGIHVCGIYPNLIKSHFLERAIFRGKDIEDVRARKHQVQQLLEVPLVEKPEQVAEAIWDAVEHHRPEVIVGSANLSAASNQFLPDLTQWFLRSTFKNQDEFRNADF